MSGRNGGGVDAQTPGASVSPALPHHARIAVVGGGIAGLAAAWLLARHHAVVVYERNGYAGGHSHTVEVPGPHGPIPVDTGFIVYNERTYPNLTRLFRHLEVPTRASEMSFAVSLDDGRLEYSGTSLAGLFAQRVNLVRPRFWSMLADLARFYRAAPALLAADGAAGEPTLRAFLARGGYGSAFVDDHLLPMAAAIWSCPTETMLDFPARSFVRFCVNHGLLQVRDRPLWRTVAGGSREYVRRLTRPFQAGLRLGLGAAAVLRDPNGVTIRDSAGGTDRFDAVVLACHGDEALALIADADARERALLSRFRYQANDAVLHSDPRLMPHRRRAWASWNYLAAGTAGARAVSVTYWMNRLQGLKSPVGLFVSLNPVTEPDPERVLGRYRYHHPVFDAGAIAAQPALASIQGRRRTWFCGSYCGYGFHEDALRSAILVARDLGAAPPWADDAAVAGTDRALAA